MAEILTLDDVLDATVLVGKILRKKGHTVHTFTEEDEAIAFARKHPVDLAILDIKLKKMSGIEVLAVLKEDNPAVRAIMLTGYPTMETAREAISLGADEYCVKPIDRASWRRKSKKCWRQGRRRWNQKVLAASATKGQGPGNDHDAWQQSIRERTNAARSAGLFGKMGKYRAE
jgi:DNA-binding NtrC family response regulator